MGYCFEIVSQNVINASGLILWCMLAMLLWFKKVPGFVKVDDRGGWCFYPGSFS